MKAVTGLSGNRGFCLKIVFKIWNGVTVLLLLTAEFVSGGKRKAGKCNHKRDFEKNEKSCLIRS